MQSNNQKPGFGQRMKNMFSSKSRTNEARKEDVQHGDYDPHRTNAPYGTQYGSQQYPAGYGQTTTYPAQYTGSEYTQSNYVNTDASSHHDKHDKHGKKDKHAKHDKHSKTMYEDNKKNKQSAQVYVPPGPIIVPAVMVPMAQQAPMMPQQQYMSQQMQMPPPQQQRMSAPMPPPPAPMPVQEKVITTTTVREQEIIPAPVTQSGVMTNNLPGSPLRMPPPPQVVDYAEERVIEVLPPAPPVTALPPAPLPLPNERPVEVMRPIQTQEVVRPIQTQEVIRETDVYVRHQDNTVNQKPFHQMQEHGKIPNPAYAGGKPFFTDMLQHPYPMAPNMTYNSQEYIAAPVQRVPSQHYVDQRQQQFQQAPYQGQYASQQGQFVAQQGQYIAQQGQYGAQQGQYIQNDALYPRDTIIGPAIRENPVFMQNLPNLRNDQEYLSRHLAESNMAKPKPYHQMQMYGKIPNPAYAGGRPFFADMLKNPNPLLPREPTYEVPLPVVGQRNAEINAMNQMNKVVTHERKDLTRDNMYGQRMY